MQRKYSPQESKRQFAVNNSDTLAILKQGQGHQTWYELVYQTNIIMQTLTHLPQTVYVKKPTPKFFFVKSENTSIISLEYAQK